MTPLDDDYFTRAAELLYNWATDDGNWITQGAVDSIYAGCTDDAFCEVQFSDGERDAMLVEEYWDEVRGPVADRIELEMDEAARTG